jgi:hypothetical protein
MTISSLAAWECNAPSTFPSLLEFIHRSKIRSVEDPICHYLWTYPYHGVGEGVLVFRRMRLGGQTHEYRHITEAY